MAPNDNEKIQHQPHRAGTDLRRELVACLLAHGPTFSRVGASGKPGAVQWAQTATAMSQGDQQALIVKAHSCCNELLVGACWNHTSPEGLAS